MKKIVLVVFIMIVSFILTFGDYNVLIPSSKNFIETVEIENYKIKYLYLKEMEKYINTDKISFGKKGNIVLFKEMGRNNLYISNLENLVKWNVITLDNFPIPSYDSTFRFVTNDNSVVFFYNNNKNLEIYQYSLPDKKWELIKTYSDSVYFDIDPSKINNNFLSFVIQNSEEKLELHLLNITNSDDTLVKKNFIGSTKLDVNTKGDVILINNIKIEYYNNESKIIKEIDLKDAYPEIIMDEPYFVTFINDNDVAIYSSNKLIILNTKNWKIKDVIYEIPDNIVGLTGLNDGSILINIYE
ncbi:hypothetical protein [Marinitoga sp. 38H-ov]|jgi:hypothetical protein|uniref:hypothetical protein n=1 Tax=Marinitoga sp. 38H-ov TaxID=1755814 RepID=UPI0013EC512C|nr:hypothetical protein [Marinitoga sp. 38H-ov]KAF2955151.1 hypothetical protein AS160_02095 [Marinitoga sp. 38H-ov]